MLLTTLIRPYNSTRNIAGTALEAIKRVPEDTELPVPVEESIGMHLVAWFSTKRHKYEGL